MSLADQTPLKTGERMHDLATDLFPICRSLTGNGVRQTLNILKKELPGLTLHEVPTGTRCFDWEVPFEWNIEDAFVQDEFGKKVIDFHASNLHVVGYSEPVDKEVSWEELNEHLFSLPEQPTAIPYITSYYKRFWGFCIRHVDRLALKPGKYRVKIQSRLKTGSLTFAELVLPGKTEEEILLSTYVCHPSMANNELSGPVVTTYLAKFLASLQHRRYTYRIVFVPETIGSIVYISKNLEKLKRFTKAGFQITCVGDERAYSYLPSRFGGTLADRAALHVLRNYQPNFTEYRFTDRGSDERQYCSPGVDLPLCSVMRTKYGKFPEYHTSLDDLTLVTPKGLQGAYDIYVKIIRLLEANKTYRVLTPCEPQLGKRGLYPNLSTKTSCTDEVTQMMDFIAYADGTADLIAIADRLGCSFENLVPIAERLTENKLFEEL